MHLIGLRSGSSHKKFHLKERNTHFFQKQVSHLRQIDLSSTIRMPTMRNGAGIRARREAWATVETLAAESAAQMSLWPHSPQSTTVSFDSKLSRQTRTLLSGRLADILKSHKKIALWLNRKVAEFELDAFGCKHAASVVAFWKFRELYSSVTEHFSIQTFLLVGPSMAMLRSTAQWALSEGFIN